MYSVMARMKLLLSLPFCFLVISTAYSQGVKKAASGDEHAADTNSFIYQPNQLITSDSVRKDSLAVIPKKQVAPDSALSAGKPPVIPSNTKKPFVHPVPYYLEVGITGNSYRGDLSSSYKSFSPSLNLGIQLNRKRWFNGYFGIAVGQVSGLSQDPGFVSISDPNLVSNTYFNTIFFTAKYELNLNIIKKDWVTAYVGLGIGFMNFTPYDQDGSTLATQSTTRAKGETYTNNSAIFPLSAGVRFSLKNYWAIHLQASLLNQTTAYIDNVKNLSTNQVGDNILGLKFAVLAPLKINR